jgi:hypothetical protein
MSKEIKETEVETPTETTLSAENVTAFIQSNPTLLTTLLEQDFAKPVLQPVLDRQVSKSIDTWKSNNLDKFVTDRVNELYPPETPEAGKLRELQQQIDNINAEKHQAELEVTKRDVLSESGLVVTFGKFISGSDEATIRTNAEELKTLIESQVNESVDARFKQTSHEPKGNSSDKEVKSDINLSKLSYSEKLALRRENPTLYTQLTSN